MNRWLRDAGKVLCAFLAVTTLIVQSVLPVYADTVNDRSESSSSGYTVSEDNGYYALDYFDRIAINSVRGVLTLKPGEDFSISFPRGWKQIPYFSVQDEILVVSGRKSAEQTQKSTDGSVVVLGEDEPADGSETAATSAEAPAAAADPASYGDTAAAVSSEEEPAEGGSGEPEDDGTVPEIVITIPSGVGLSTLRIAMEKGDLIMTDITANAVTIQSGGGNLVMKDVSLGTVDIYSDAGSVSLSECAFNSLNVGMAEGEVSVSSEDSLVRCRMEIKTDDGEITFNGAAEGSSYMQPGNGKRFLTIQVGSGDIDISS